MRMTLNFLLKKIDKCVGHFLFKVISQVVLLTKTIWQCHCVKSVRIWSYSGQHFFRIRTEYRECEKMRQKCGPE